MNTRIKILSSAVLLTALAFTACKKEPVEPLYRSVATVVNPDSVTNYTIISDKGAVMKPTNAGRALKDRQRIITDFYIVDEKGEESSYDYDIEYVYLYEILTKGIFNIELDPMTPEMEDSIGKDPFVDVREPWIAADFLNVEFFIRTSPYSNVKHFINLVAYPDSVPAADGKVHLQLRHNDNDAYQETNSWGIAAFDLLPLKEQFAAAQDSVDIILHAQQYNGKETTYKVVYHLKDDSESAEPDLAGKASSTLFE